MALLRKFFYRKPPDGLFEICERVYVFESCFTTDVWLEEDYRVYLGTLRVQLSEHYPDASILVFNFGEGQNNSRVNNVFAEYDMTIMSYPKHYEGCPLLSVELINHFLRSSESWLSVGQQNVILMHCERGGWPVLAFLLAALLLYRKYYTGEFKTLDMLYKQAHREILYLLSPLNPIPSQLRYLQYVSRRNVASQWPPLDRALTLDCVMMRMIPNFDGKGGCRPIFRIYGQDPLHVSDRTPKVLFSTPKRSKIVRHYKQGECQIVKIDINCQIQGDVVLECISLCDDLDREEMMFRVMFNTAFIRSNILMLNREEIDTLWDAKDRFPKEFRAEVLFSEMDAAIASRVPVDLSCFEEKEGLPEEAFAKVQEIFSSGDWLVTRADVARDVIQQITASPPRKETATILHDLLPEKQLAALDMLKKSTPSSSPSSSSSSSPSPPPPLPPSPPPPPPPGKGKSTKVPTSAIQTPSTGTVPKSLLSHLLPPHLKTQLLETHGTKVCLPKPSSPLSPHHPFHFKDSGDWVATSPPPPPPPLPPKATKIQSPRLLPSPPPPPSLDKEANTPPPPPPTPPPVYSTLPAPSRSLSPSFLPHIPPTLSVPPPPSPPPPPSVSNRSLGPPSPLIPSEGGVPLPQSPSVSGRSLYPPSPRLPSAGGVPQSPSPRVSSRSLSPPSPRVPSASSVPPPPPPPPGGGKSYTSPSPPPVPSPRSGPPPPPPPSRSNSSSLSPPPPPIPSASGIPPPPPLGGGKSSFSPPPPPVPSGSSAPPPPPPGGGNSSLSPPPPPGMKGRLTRITNLKNNQNKLKPLHWLKITRAVQGSLWAEAQKSGAKAPEIDISELETLFSAAAPNSGQRGPTKKSNSRSSVAAKPEKVQLIDHRRAYNCEIMLSKVKVPLSELMASVLTLENSAIDEDQVENLIKFCPTKEEMETLKAYNGEKDKLGKCEQFFLELMQVPRTESKLRVYSFKIQFGSQVSDLKNSLNVVNSIAEQIRSSNKLKKVMQTILSLGNALNQGTARGAAVGFKLDSLLKLTETRARNNKITLMHYLCKILADKLPDVLDFSKDLASLEASSKIQLKFLAEEMQSISKGLEKVVQELSMSENDGPVSENFRKALKKFLSHAEGEVRSLASLYSGVGRNVDSLIVYFGEDPARCPFEQVVTTLLNFVKMFNKAHDENCKQIELEKKKAAKEAENEKLGTVTSQKSPRKTVK